MGEELDVLFAYEAEAQLLGCVLLEPAIADWIDVDARCFANARNEKVWRAMRALRDAGLEIDVATLEVQLQRMKALEAIGGLPYLSELALKVPDTQRVEQWAKVLHDRRVAREIFMLAGELRQRALEDEGDEALGFAMRRCGEIDTRAHDGFYVFEDMVKAEVRTQLDRLDDEVDTGVIRTGIEALDSRVVGIPIGKPTLLGARPGTGKSAAALVMARHFAAAGNPTAVFTYEDRFETWARRTIAQEALIPVPVQEAASHSRDQVSAMLSIDWRSMHLGNLYLQHAHGWKVDRVVRKSRSLIASRGVRVVIVDYIQPMPNPNSREFRSRKDHVRENLRQLQDMAGEQNIAVLVLWQLTREFARSNGPPEMHSFADSSAAEEYGKMIWALWEPPTPAPRYPGDPVPGPGEQLELVVLKNNNGEECSVRLHFDRPNMRIE